MDAGRHRPAKFPLSREPRWRSTITRSSSVTVGSRTMGIVSCESERRGLFQENYFRLCQTTSSLVLPVVVIFPQQLLIRHRGLVRVNQRDEDYLMKTTSSLVTFCGGDATFCQITVYTYGSAAVLPKHVCQQHCAGEQVYTL